MQRLTVRFLGKNANFSPENIAQGLLSSFSQRPKEGVFIEPYGQGEKLKKTTFLRDWQA